MTGAPATDRTESMELLISRVLIWGVGLSAAVVIVGGALLLAQHGASPVAITTFRGEPMSLKSVGGILAGAAALKPRSIIQLGLVLLVATPVTRVALSVLLFWQKKDYLYVGITGVVLAILILAIADEN